MSCLDTVTVTSCQPLYFTRSLIPDRPACLSACWAAFTHEPPEHTHSLVSLFAKQTSCVNLMILHTRANVSLMWFVYVFIFCLCVHARVLCILTDICLSQVKGVKTSGFCFSPNRRRMMFYQSLYLTVGVCKSVCLGCAATKNPTLSANFRRTFSTDWANFSLEGHKLSLEVVSDLEASLSVLGKNMCLYLMKWVCTLWVSEPEGFLCAKCINFSLILSYFTQFNDLCVFHPRTYIVPVIDTARENTHVRLLIHFYKQWLSVAGFNILYNIIIILQYIISK